MAKKAKDNSTPISSAVIFPERDGSKTIRLSQLVRIVAVLPLHELMPLTDAFVQAEKRLGSGELAARDLTKHARAGRLTVAVQWVERGGIELAGIPRSAFWQYYKISLDRLEPVVVRGARTAGMGRPYFFVRRRRFDRLYSTAAPSKPVERRPSPKQSQPEDRKLTLLPEEPQFEPRNRRKPEEANKWLAEQITGDPRKPDETKNEWARRKYPDMKRDFGEDIPWKDWTVLRRRMNDP
jgi:hypothetical protein